MRAIVAAVRTRHAAVVIIAVVRSIAAVCRNTAARAGASEPGAVISRAGASARHKGINAGTSIIPAPFAVDIANDKSASPACPARDDSRCAKQHPNAASTNPASNASSGCCSARICRGTPSAAAAATSAIATTCPNAIGSNARKGIDASRERTVHAAATAQPLAGFRPCSAPAPATASQGHMPATPCLRLAGQRAQALSWQQPLPSAFAAGTVSYRSWCFTQAMV